jgi:hypothetical protein
VTPCRFLGAASGLEVSRKLAPGVRSVLNSLERTCSVLARPSMATRKRADAVSWVSALPGEASTSNQKKRFCVRTRVVNNRMLGKTEFMKRFFVTGAAAAAIAAGSLGATTATALADPGSPPCVDAPNCANAGPGGAQITVPGAGAQADNGGAGVFVPGAGAAAGPGSAEANVPGGSASAGPGHANFCVPNFCANAG